MRNQINNTMLIVLRIISSFIQRIRVLTSHTLALSIKGVVDNGCQLSNTKALEDLVVPHHPLIPLIFVVSNRHICICIEENNHQLGSRSRTKRNEFLLSTNTHGIHKKSFRLVLLLDLIWWLFSSMHMQMYWLLTMKKRGLKEWWGMTKSSKA